MSLINKDHLSLTLQAIKKLLSFKAEKDEVVFRSEIEDEDALAIAMEMELVSPVAADDGSIYTDENGAMYSL